MKKQAISIALMTLLFGCTASAPSLNAFINDFYDSNLVTTFGILEDDAVKAYVSDDLRVLFSKAREVQDTFATKHPDLKPRLVDTLLFTSVPHDQPTKRTIQDIKEVNGIYKVTVSFDAIEGNDRCADKLFISSNDDLFEIADIELGCYESKKLSTLLSESIKDHQK
ncbi:hypothetical protein H0A36_30075 [Endozoicomonas sp. SM1973]|uniref:DUF3828 domain-containing protein n=1 Tax=Spartinivicinus marinus TaxID=2994442 RepID=A0A853IAC5_9GAMM|nr:hypothetical protein [Spartinivicinus marinus]MCX4027865.1 hypothetical protein [Spartinivicinus marinus]NYZ70263.1 hypothetical protein [Spartinivicinus marinus]